MKKNMGFLGIKKISEKQPFERKKVIKTIFPLLFFIKERFFIFSANP
jgi:hypothetical protein